LPNIIKFPPFLCAISGNSDHWESRVENQRPKTISLHHSTFSLFLQGSTYTNCENRICCLPLKLIEDEAGKAYRTL
jgi:hypothetical protein